MKIENKISPDRDIFYVLLTEMGLSARHEAEYLIVSGNDKDSYFEFDVDGKYVSSGTWED